MRDNESADELRVSILFVGPTVSPEMLVEWYHESHETDALVLAKDPPTDHYGRSIRRQASHHLDAAGWRVPDGLINAGGHLGVAGKPVDAAAWFAAFEREDHERDELLRTVRSPAAVVDTLEAMLEDAIVPTPDGWYPRARGRVRGDGDALARRHSTLAKALPSFDVGVAPDALGRARPTAFAREALTSYVDWCLEGGIVTPGIRNAMAAHLDSVEPTSDETLLLVDGEPTAAPLTIAKQATASRLTVAVPVVPTGRLRRAWFGSAAEIEQAIIDRLAGVDEYSGTPRLLTTQGGSCTASSIDDGEAIKQELLDVNRLPASISHVEATDPTASALTVLDRLGRPADACIVVSTRQQARRFMRLAASGATPVARGGEVDPFQTRIATLSLAWLRIIQGVRPDRGWAVVLDSAGCTWGDLEAWLDGDERPAAFATLRGELAGLPNGLAVIGSVARRYGADPRATETLISALVDGDEVPSTAATLDRLASTAPAVRLPEPPEDRATVRTTPPGELTPVVIHVTADNQHPGAALTYRPPLGVQTTRTIETVDGHPLELSDPYWAALAPARTERTARNDHRVIASLARATERGIVVGPDGQVY